MTTRTHYKSLIASWCLGFLMGVGCTLLAGGCLVQSRPVPERHAEPELRQHVAPSHRFDAWCVNHDCQTRAEAEI